MKSTPIGVSSSSSSPFGSAALPAAGGGASLVVGSLRALGDVGCDAMSRVESVGQQVERSGNKVQKSRLVKTLRRRGAPAEVNLATTKHLPAPILPQRHIISVFYMHRDCSSIVRYTSHAVYVVHAQAQSKLYVLGQKSIDRHEKQ